MVQRSRNVILQLRGATVPVMVENKDTRCGFLGWYPKWLQAFASKKSYVLIYGVFGMFHIAINTYLSGTITTIEKRFKIPSRTTGFIISSLDIGSIAVIFFAYLGGQSHKSRWVAYAGIMITISCFIRVLPHMIYGAGQDAIDLVFANVSNSNGFERRDISLCGFNNTKAEDCMESGTNSIAPTAIFMISQIFYGIGTSCYWSLGVAYMDDNTRKDKVAALVSATAFIRMLGPTIGLFLASYSLEKYIDPSLNPTINTNDPRWVGAWWLAWIPLGIINLILSILMVLFPKTLPRAAMRQKELDSSEPPHKPPEKSLKDFITSMRRLLSNRILVLNTLSTLAYMFGMIGYWVFLPKYMESQFQQSASRANLVTGSVGLIFSGLGLLVSGGVISRYKPNARFLAGWNVFVGIIDTVGHFLFIYIGCPVEKFHGTQNSNFSWDLTAPCNADCNCSQEIKYDPVCHLETSTTFYSPCHAGCSVYSTVNNSRIISNCSCAGPSGTVISGICPVDCSQDFLTFVVLISILHFFSSTGRAGTSLVQFRCVSSDDKALSIGFLELCMIFVSFIPGPIVYGILLDNVCIIWGLSCGTQGHCWLYDSQRLRTALNGTASIFLLTAAVFDIGVWYNVKDLQIYDKDEVKKERTTKRTDENSH